MADHNKLKSALKTMTTAPDEIRAADDAYKAKLKELEKYTDTYSPALMRKEKGEARDRRNRVIDNLMGQMETAVQTIAANNEFDSEKLDITDPKLQAAINAVALAGRGLDVDSQLSILEQFRGNPAANTQKQSPQWVQRQPSAHMVTDKAERDNTLPAFTICCGHTAL